MDDGCQIRSGSRQVCSGNIHFPLPIGEAQLSSNSSHKQFASGWGFVLAAVGSAVGMANVWGFPAKLGSNGGGAFLIIYLLFIALFGNIGLTAEYAVGRRAGTGTLGSYEMAWSLRGSGTRTAGKFIGWLPLAGSMCIAIGYAVIISYVFQALGSSLTGELSHVDTEQWFSSFSGTSFSVAPWHVIVVVVTLLTLALGAKGIEKTNRIMMPLFFIIFIVLAIRVAMMPGSSAGYAYMFTCRWEQLLDPMVWVWAMGQAFFSLSITGSGMIVYGAYLGKNEDVAALGRKTALFDTVAAMTAALVIIPACFAYQFDVGAGPSLLFVTLPRILQDIPFGQVFAIILYIALVFAGISSLQNMLEAVGESLLYRFPRLNRRLMLVLLCVICLGFGLFMEEINIWGPWMDVVSIYIIPIGATLGAVSWFWIMPRKDLMSAVDLGAGRHAPGKRWYLTGRYLYVPCSVLLCIIALFMQISF